MKLIYCPECCDIVRLMSNWRRCQCGAARGAYRIDGLHVDIEGTAIPLGIDSYSFRQAMRNRPERGPGELFTAFVIPKECATVHKEFDNGT